jgi:hypothetical protein
VFDAVELGVVRGRQQVGDPGFAGQEFALASEIRKPAEPVRPLRKSSTAGASSSSGALAGA